MDGQKEGQMHAQAQSHMLLQLFQSWGHKNEFSSDSVCTGIEIKIMPFHEFGMLTNYSRSGGSDKPVYPYSLPRAFAARINRA